MSPQLQPATVRLMIDLAQHATAQDAPALFAAFSHYLEPALVALEGQPAADAERHDAERVMLAFIAGLCAGNPAFTLLGAPPQMVRALAGSAD